MRQTSAGDLLGDVAVEPVARAPGHLVQHPEVHRPEVVADEPRQHLRRAARPAKPRGDGRDPLGADPVVADEPGAPVGVDAPRLRLGHVVEQHGQLPDLAAREAASHRLRRTTPPPARRGAPGGRRSPSRASAASSARSECSHTVKRCGSGLGRLAHRLDLGQDHAKDGPRVGLADGGRAPGHPQDAGSAPRERARPRPRRAPAPPPAPAPPSPARWRSRAGGRAAGSGGRARGRRRTPSSRRHGAAGGQIAEAAGGIVDRRRPAEQRVEVDGERIDGDVAPGQVRLEARPPEVGQVDLERRRPGQDHARHAVRLAERNERASETIREAASRRAAPVREGEVDVVNRPLEQEVADRAADQPDGSADRLRDGREQRPHRIERPERSRRTTRPMPACHAMRGSRRGAAVQRRGSPRAAGPATARRYRAALNSFTSGASNSTSTFGPLDAVSSKLSFPARRLGSSALVLSAAGRCVPECWTFWSLMRHPVVEARAAVDVHDQALGDLAVGAAHRLARAHLRPQVLPRQDEAPDHLLRRRPHPDR